MIKLGKRYFLHGCQYQRMDILLISRTRDMVIPRVRTSTLTWFSPGTVYNEREVVWKRRHFRVVAGKPHHYASMKRSHNENHTTTHKLTGAIMTSYCQQCPAITSRNKQSYMPPHADFFVLWNLKALFNMSSPTARLGGKTAPWPNWM